MSKLAHSNQETMNKIESQSCKYQHIEDIVVAVIDSNVESVAFKETVGHCAREIIAAIYAHSETDAQPVPVEPEYAEACEFDNEDSVVSRIEYDALRGHIIRVRAESAQTCRLGCTENCGSCVPTKAAEAGLPVEPKFREFRGCLKPVDRGMWVNGPSNFYSASEVDAAIETLQSALKLAQEERDRTNRLRKEDAKYISRLRGEADADEDLKHFVYYVDHTSNLSSGAVSEIIDFAQGQKKRAEKAESLAEQFRKVIDQAARVMRGEGVNDQGEAWDKCLQILDAAIDSAGAE